MRGSIVMIRPCWIVLCFLLCSLILSHFIWGSGSTWIHSGCQDLDSAGLSRKLATVLLTPDEANTVSAGRTGQKFSIVQSSDEVGSLRPVELGGAAAVIDAGTIPLARRSEMQRRIHKRSRANQCWSRSERRHYDQYYAQMVQSSEDLVRKVTNYAELHRLCTTGVKNWTAVISGEDIPSIEGASKENSQGSSGQLGGATCQFLLLEITSNGLGNRIQAIVAAFAYALLTNRVLLISDWAMSVMLCQPFPGSDWYLPIENVEFSKGAGHVSTAELCESEETWSTKAEQLMKGGRIPNAVAEFRYEQNKQGHFDWKVEDQSFFCERAQERLRSVTWLLLSTEQYYVPGLFLIPSFRAELEKLFPDLAPFTHLARYLLHPSNLLWERITRLYALHFRHSAQRVGVQIRTFLDNDTYAHERVLDCLVNVSGSVPAPIPASDWLSKVLFFGPDADETINRAVQDPAPRQILLYVTSLHSHHGAYLRATYTEGVAVDGTQVDVHSYESEGSEVHDLERDVRALTELWLLTFCETLLTSHFSTFGYIASGISGRPAYLMNVISQGANSFAIPMEENGRPVCELSVSAEPCSHWPPHKRRCTAGAGGESVGEQEAVGGEEVPAYVQPCQDAAFGYRIVSRLSSPDPEGT